MTFVSIIMPALNEERYIASAIASLQAGLDDFDYEILVMDGGSSDKTRQIVDAMAARDGRISLHRNPGRLQSAGMNLGARLTNRDTDVIVRADCHSIYPDDFVRNCVAELKSRHVASVVVPMTSVGVTCLQRGIAYACNSTIGNGGSRHRSEGWSGFVEHGHHAAFDAATFHRVGGYNETYSHNEDAELDTRIVQAGGRIWMAGHLAIRYFPRARLTDLARQYFKYGCGRARTALEHRSRLRLRQLSPTLLAAGVPLLALAALLVHPALFAPVVAYALALLVWSGMVAMRRRELCLLAAAPAAAVMHFSWGYGFIKELVLTGLRSSRRSPVLNELNAKREPDA